MPGVCPATSGRALFAEPADCVGSAALADLQPASTVQSITAGSAVDRDLCLYCLRAWLGLMEATPERGNGMGRIEGEIVIGRPVDVVFDYVTDQSNEPQYNPQMVRAEKITPGPVGKGTRFRSAVASRGSTVVMLIECTGYDRPTLFATTTTMAQADIGYTLRFEPAPAGTRMRWSGQVQPKGIFRLLGPLITWLGSRQEQRIWAALKRHLEATPTGPATTRPIPAAPDRR